MQRIRPHVDPSADRGFADGVAAIISEHHLPAEFDDEVLEQAAAAAAAVRLPDLDHTAVPFVTLDPPGAVDLDQALWIERDGDGYVVWYAIADVAAFVTPGSALDRAAHQRGETVYAPDRRLPLHPEVLGEGAASLLPDEVRPALVWRLHLDEVGELVRAHVERARVRSRAQYEYASVQATLDAEAPDPVFALLRDVGRLRLELERERGGVSLALPDQEVRVVDGVWSLVHREQLPVETWNAQLSLLTGIAASRLMLYAEVGLVRTLPEADPRTVARLRRTAAALELDWPHAMDYADFVRSLHPDRPADAAMLRSCTSLLRGASYVAFDGAVPPQPRHAALATTYAHATAPLRRLADRYVGEVCVSLCADTDPPEWVTRALPDLPATMLAAGRRVGGFERAVLNLVEARLLADRVGETYPAVVVATDEDDVRQGTVVVRDPAVEARVESDTPLPLGHAVTVRLDQVDVDQRRVAFVVV